MSTRATRHNIGADLTTFIGRTDEVREIRRMLREVRLVTLVGIGGVGKSRIAAAVGVALHRAFRDGVWRADFSAVQDPRFLAQTIQDTIPGPNSVRSLADQIGDQNMLLVFDNCDRMTEALADLSVALLSRCPHLKILATSRTPFVVSPERVFRLTSFALESPVAALHAVELFSDRAHAASGATYDASERSMVADLCARLDGLPLAIELAALRTRTMSVDEISSRLSDRFELLRGGHRDLHPRHQSLSALLEWTWDQCSVAQRALWAQFAVFAGVATLSALESVCVLPGSSSAADVVDELLQQSIIIRRQVGGIVTFRMLDTMREYGEQRLADEFEVLGGVTLDDLRERHMSYYAELVQRTESTWFGPHQKRASAVISGEIANIRAAFDWSIETAEHCESGAAMVAGLWFYWIGCGHLKEGRTLSQLAWERLQHFGKPSAPHLLWTLAWNLLITGEVARAEQHLAECVSRAKEVDDARSLAYSHALLAAVHFFHGDYDRSLELYESAIAESRSRADDLAVAMFTYHLGEAHSVSRRFDAAEECSRTAIEICTRNGDRWCLAYAYWVQALAAFFQGDRERTEDRAREALALMAPLEDHLGIALIGELLGWTAAGARDYQSAAALAGATDAYWTEMGCAVMGIPALIAQRNACLRATAEHLSARSLTAATAKGGAQGLSWVTTHFTGEAPPKARTESVTPPAARPSMDNLAFLTEREREIAGLIVRGLTNQDIAEILVVGKRTVDTHVGHILAKCGARRRGELIPLLFNLSEDARDT